jgi:glycosyltransferase involved in cell wall biosynthesis
LLAELTKRSEFECWVLLNAGGPLEAEFARHAPTLNLDVLRQQGTGEKITLEVIASLFQRHAVRGFALCNTAATWEINVALARQGVPVVSWLHELPTSIDIYHGGEATFTALLRSSTRILLPAEFVRARLLQRYGCDDPAKLQVFYNGNSRLVMLPRDAARSGVRDELHLPAEALIVLACGTVEQRKGSDLFPQIASRVLSRPEGSQAWFVWVGNTPDHSVLSWCRHDAQSLNIADRVLFVGEREAVGRFFAAADIFALPSREDPLPLVTMEAMAAGLPVIAFRESGGTPDLLKDGGGTVVPYMDLDRFADAIVELLQDHERRRITAERAVAVINGRAFSWPKFADNLRTLLEHDLDFFPTKLGEKSSVDAELRTSDPSRT